MSGLDQFDPLSFGQPTPAAAPVQPPTTADNPFDLFGDPQPVAQPAATNGTPPAGLETTESSAKKDKKKKKKKHKKKARERERASTTASAGSAGSTASVASAPTISHRKNSSNGSFWDAIGEGDGRWDPDEKPQETFRESRKKSIVETKARTSSAKKPADFTPIKKDSRMWSKRVVDEPGRTMKKVTVTWKFVLDETSHLVELKHSVVSGKRVVVADGQMLINTKKLIGSASYKFTLKGPPKKELVRCKLYTAVNSWKLTLNDAPFDDACAHWLSRVEYEA